MHRIFATVFAAVLATPCAAEPSRFVPGLVEVYDLVNGSFDVALDWRIKALEEAEKGRGENNLHEPRGSLGIS